MVMTVSELQVKVSADTSAAESGLSSLGGKLGSIGGSLATAFGGAAIAGIAALGAGLTASTVAAAGFESQMSAVKAVSGATAGEMAGLSDLALKLGADTSFSASDAAKGIEELVKAGVSIGDVLGGAASASLSLAAAGAVSVGDAAEIAANAMNQFGLRGTDLAHVADLIAGAANASAIDVNDFKFSLAAVGAVANTVGFSFDDTATAIALLGQAGIKGSDAGTSLKTMLLNLQPATDKQTALFRELGLITADGSNKFFDATGKVKGMAEVAGTLQTALSGMTQQQKLATLETIFGSDAIRAAAVFANQGAEGFNEMAASMGKVTAEAVAAERLNNLKGDIEQLTGSLETAGIKIGTAFLPGLRSIVQGSTEIVNKAAPILEQFARDAASNIETASTQIQDSWRTAKQAFAGQWLPSDQIPPFVNAVGQVSTAMGRLSDVVAEAADKAGRMGAWDNLNNSLGILKGAAQTASDRIDDIAEALGRARDPAERTANAADVLAAAFKGAATGLQYAALQVEGFVDALGSGIAVAIDYTTGLSEIGQALQQLQRGDFPGAWESLREANAAFAAGEEAAEGFRQRGLDRVADGARLMSELVSTHMTASSETVRVNMDAASAAVSEGSAGMQQFMEANVSAMAGSTETGMATVSGAVTTGMTSSSSAVETGGAAMVAGMDSAGSGMAASATSGMGQTVGAIQAAAPGGPSAIDAMGAGMVSSLQGSGGGLASAASSIVSGAISAAQGAAGGAGSVGAAIGSSIRDGIMGAAGSIAAAAANIVHRAISAARAAAGGAGDYEGRARGGPIRPGQIYTVGERGPELFMSSEAGRIIPNRARASIPADVTRSWMGGGGSSGPVETHHFIVRDPSGQTLADWWVTGRETAIRYGRATS